MEDNMALTNSSELFCLVCSSNVDLNNCTNIFYVSLPHNGEVLANFVMKVLKLSTSDLRSSYICLRCHNLFGMLEQAQWTAANIQCEIFKVFQTCSNGKSSINGSLESIPKVNEVTENFSETERLNQINDSKVLITEHLSGKDLNSLNNITNQIASDTVISNEVETKYINESHVISNEEEPKLVSYASIKQCLETDKVSNEPYKTEATILNDEPSIFSNEVIKTNAEDQKISHWQDVEDTFNLQNSTSINESAKPRKPPSPPAGPPSSWKSGRISKYSQKPLKHSCPTCGKKWRTSTELRTHVRSHSNLRPYMCEKCGQAYKHKHALEIHVGMHSGVSPFRCSHCDKCFTQKGALQRHLPMHTGETPYQCELCGKRFVHHTSYNMHALSHTGKKSYRCHLCDLSLLSTSHLKRHMRVHTGERPYSCELCGKSFAERYNLLAHQKIHDPLQVSARETRRNQYKCEQCALSFSKKQKYDEHMAKHALEAKADDKWLGHTVEVVVEPTRPQEAFNGADLLESCVNEVWQSLAKD